MNPMASARRPEGVGTASSSDPLFERKDFRATGVVLAVASALAVVLGWVGAALLVSALAYNVIGCAFIVSALALLLSLLRAKSRAGRIAFRVSVQAIVAVLGLIAVGMASNAAEEFHRRVLHARGEALVQRIEAFHRERGAYPTCLPDLSSADGKRIPSGHPSDWGYMVKGNAFGLEISLGFMDLRTYDSRSGEWLDDRRQAEMAAGALQKSPGGAPVPERDGEQGARLPRRRRGAQGLTAARCLEEPCALLGRLGHWPAARSRDASERVLGFIPEEHQHAGRHHPGAADARHAVHDDAASRLDLRVDGGGRRPERLLRSRHAEVTDRHAREAHAERAAGLALVLETEQPGLFELQHRHHARRAELAHPAQALLKMLVSGGARHQAEPALEAEVDPVDVDLHARRIPPHSEVVGSMMPFTSLTRFAGNPPCRACSRTSSAFGAM